MPISADRSLTKTIDMRPTNSDGVTMNWWMHEDEETLYQSVFQVASAIVKSQSSRTNLNFYYASLYNGQLSGLDGFITSSYASSLNSDVGLGGIALNVVQNCIDSAAAMISKNKPKPLFLTDGTSDYDMKMRAKGLTKYVAGVFEDAKIYEVAQRVFTSAGIYGTGAIKLFDDGERIKAEWVFIEELLVSDVDGFKEKPRQMHQRKYIAREVLASQFPDKKAEIEAATSAISGAADQMVTDMILVIESWHLPSSDKAKDGKHCITIENATLLSEDYKKDYFPIVCFRWYHKSIGFFGRGIAEELADIQNEITFILQTIQQAQRLVAVPVWFVENASGVSEDHLLSNEIARMVEYSGQPPIPATPAAVPAELYQHLQYLEDRAYKIIGLSQANATGRKPEGLQSGKAIQEVADMASGRFETIGQEWERFFMRLAEIIVDMSKDLFAKNPDLSINAMDKRNLERIQWKDVDMDRDQFAIQLFPISGLPTSPAGRIDAITQYTQNGWIPKEQAMDLLDFPDLEGFISPETSTVRLTNAIISGIKKDGDKSYKSPIPQMDLPTAFRISSLEVVNAELQGVEQDHIELIRKFSVECQDLLQAAQQQAQAMQPPAQPGQPGQAPQPPPQQ